VPDEDGIRVGVAKPGLEDTEPLRDKAGGGPIDPSKDRLLAAVPATVLLVRTLFPKAGFVAVDGVSLSLRSLTLLPTSDKADGGREAGMLGVPKIDDSLRW